MATPAVGEPSPTKTDQLEIANQNIVAPKVSYATTIQANAPQFQVVQLKELSYLHGEPRIIWEMMKLIR